jgi:TIR domain
MNQRAISASFESITMPSESTNVFVSYSHADLLLVSPVVKLLRVNKSLVFQDIDDIQPGKRWQGEIAKALAESHLVVVFWCNHASQSNEVSKEWQAALVQKKDLLPVLLDPTPLPPELAEFQAIDFRGTVGANHSSIPSMDSAVDIIRYSLDNGMPSHRPARRLLLTACVVFGVTAVLSWFFALKSTPPKSFPHRPPHPFPWGEILGFSVRSLLVLGICFAVAACLIWLERRFWKRQIHYEFVPPAEAIERHIASELEAEILHRTTLRRESGK